MRGLRILLAHFKASLLEIKRQPMYLLSTLVFPSMFFWFFGVPNAKTPESALLLSTSFSCYAVLGVLMFQFGVGVAQERNTSWAEYLHLLPMPSWVNLAAKLLSGLVIAVVAINLVFLTGHLSAGLDISISRLLAIELAIILGGIPFGLLGFALGYLCDAKSALPIANLIYLPLSFAGGLWIPPNGLPQIVQDISVYLPTRMYGELTWAMSFDKDLPNRDLMGLLLYFILFLALALMAFRLRREN